MINQPKSIQLLLLTNKFLIYFDHKRFLKVPLDRLLKLMLYLNWQSTEIDTLMRLAPTRNWRPTKIGTNLKLAPT